MDQGGTSYSHLQTRLPDRLSFRNRERKLDHSLVGYASRKQKIYLRHHFDLIRIDASQGSQLHDRMKEPTYGLEHLAN